MTKYLPTKKKARLCLNDTVKLETKNLKLQTSLVYNFIDQTPNNSATVYMSGPTNAASKKGYLDLSYSISASVNKWL